MKKLAVAVLCLVGMFILAACSKKTTEEKAGKDQSVANTASPSTEIAPNPAAVAEPSPEAQELAKKQALLEYGMMEDSYINDSRAQWASSAKASSTYGESKEDPAQSSSSSYGADKATGGVDGNTWSNNQQNLGFDWLILDYHKPVSATEVRIVFKSGRSVEAVSKIELIDNNNQLHTVWSGISDIKDDSRGNRTWFVRKFAATPYKAKGVKITLANSLVDGYKEIDAVQLVGDN